MLKWIKHHSIILNSMKNVYYFEILQIFASVRSSEIFRYTDKNVVESILSQKLQVNFTNNSKEIAWNTELSKSYFFFFKKIVL